MLALHEPSLVSQCSLESGAGAPPPLPPPRLKSQMPGLPSAPAVRGSTLASASSAARSSTTPGDASVQMRAKPALPPKPGSKPSIYLPAKPVTVSSFAQTDPLRELPPLGAKPTPLSAFSIDRTDAFDRSSSSIRSSGSVPFRLQFSDPFSSCFDLFILYSYL